MKIKLFKSISLAVALAFGLGTSAQCLNINGDMETFTGPIITSPNAASNMWINDNLDNWYVTHGSPTTGSLSPTTNMWMWSYSGAGEGVYTEYNFVAGQTYELCYDLWRDGTSNPTSEFRVQLSNAFTPYYGTSSAYPAPVGNQTLTTQPWTGTGTWVTIVETFTASANYGQLWMHPFLAGAPTPWQAACRIDNICVKAVAVDPCDFIPEFEVFYDEKCNVRFENTTVVPPGFTILSTTWDFGDGTTGSGSPIDHFYTIGGGGVYTVCMTVWMINKDGECCQLTVCKKIDGPECDPCDWIRNLRFDVTGTNPITFNASGLPSGLYNLLGYHWNFGDGSFGTGNPVTHPYATGGGYYVCLTVYYYDPETRTCCSFEYCMDVEVGDPVFADGGGKAPIKILQEGVNYENESIDGKLPTFETVVISPNPSNGEFELRLKNGGAINTMAVYDQAGKLVHSSTNTQNTTRFNMDLTKLESGAYIIIINEADDATRQFSKLIIE